MKYLRSTTLSFEDISNKNQSLGQRLIYKSVNILLRSRISPSFKSFQPRIHKTVFLIICSSKLNGVFRTMEVFEENSKEIMTTVTKVNKVFISFYHIITELSVGIT